MDNDKEKSMMNIANERPVDGCTMFFELNIQQVRRLEAWRNHIKAIQGKVGHEEFCFHHTGIYTTCIVKNKDLNVELDLTDYEGQ